MLNITKFKRIPFIRPRTSITNRFFSETRKTIEEILNKPEDTLVVNELAGLDKRSILRNLKIKFDQANNSQNDFYDSPNVKEDSILVKDFFAPTRRLLKCYNANFLPPYNESKFDMSNGSSLRQKGIQFRSGKWLEDVILLRCNNMRVFYIETIRCFTVLEK